MIEWLGQSSFYLVPLVALVVGLASSLHCAGMCGPLVMAVAHDKKSVLIYQLGRLLAYLSVATLLSFVGKVTLQQLSPHLSIYTTYLIALLFIVLGLTVFVKKNLELPFPKIFSQSFLKFTTFVHKKFQKSYLGAALVGFASILLPCALLYAVIFSLVAVRGLIMSLVAISFFWIGTLPAMVLGPHFFRKYLNRFLINFPRLTGLLLIGIGLANLYWRHIKPHHHH